MYKREYAFHGDTGVIISFIEFCQDAPCTGISIHTTGCSGDTVCTYTIIPFMLLIKQMNQRVLFSTHTYSLKGREIINHFLTSSHHQFVIIEAERRVEL